MWGFLFGCRTNIQVKKNNFKDDVVDISFKLTVVEIHWCSNSNISISCFHFVLPGEDAEEDDAEENPIAIDFQDVQDAFYMKDPRKALQGFFDREGTFHL